MPEAACQFQVIPIREGGHMRHLSINSVRFDLISIVSLHQLSRVVLPLPLLLLVLVDLGREGRLVPRHNQDCIKPLLNLPTATITLKLLLRTDSRH